MVLDLLIDYDGDKFKCSVDSAETVTFEEILGSRDLLLCWLLDPVSQSWMRIPRIEVLRMLLTTLIVEGEAEIRFQLSSKSPNASPDLAKPNLGGDKVEESVVLEQMCDDQTVCLAVHAGSLLTQIRMEAERGTSPFEVIVTAEDQEGTCRTVQLTQSVWNKCLLRGHATADLFQDYILSGFHNLYGLAEKLKELHCNHDLWLRLRCFHFDLKHFAAAQSRLQDYGGEYYMSSRYFSSDEQAYLLDFPTASGATAHQSLAALFSSMGQISEVCTSHDLAPAIEKIYGIRKGYEQEKGFKAYFKTFAGRKGTF